MAEKDKRSYNILAMEGITDQEYVDNFGVPQELAYTKGINKWLIEDTYKNNAPTEFSEAEQLLEVRINETTLMFVSLYVDNDAMERASAARTKRMDLNKDLIDSMDGKTGEVILNHSN